MRRVLIVSPHFPPVNAPDHQRVRMALPYFRENGWEPEVVAVEPSQVLAPLDPFLIETLPMDVPIHRVTALAPGWGRIPGLGGLGYRCRAAVARQVHALLRDRQEPTLIYFSTTQFAVHGIIPSLHRYPGVKVVIDYQDPWVSSYYRRHPQVRPPGGRLKYAIDRFLARRTQASVLRRVAGCTAVSSRYPEEIRADHPWLRPEHFLVLPFGGAARDFEILGRHPVAQSQFARRDGALHWVYAGRGGPDMAPALSAFFGALRLALAQQPELAALRLHFLGTDYAAGKRARLTVKPLADAAGVGALVDERPHRLGYGETLQCLLDADALIVPGSDDPGYTASKLYPYILARRPLLTIFREESSVVTIMRETQAGVCVAFTPELAPGRLTQTLVEQWFQSRAYRRPPATDWPAFEPYTARAMTARLCTFFDRLIPA